MPTPPVIAVRQDDLDSNGHVRGDAYVAYADHARWELVRAAGVSLDKLASAGIGPVNLETRVRYRSELRGGEQVAVTTEFTYDEKTGTAHQELRRTSDDVLVAEVDSVTGMLDLSSRRLVAGHGDRMRALVTHPELLGL